MVISGAGPKSFLELDAQDIELVFPIQIVSIIVPVQVVAFSHVFTDIR